MSSIQKTRQANFEVLRIFAMYLILLWHMKLHFMADSDVFHPLVVKVINLIASCITFHVDLFILITGYFGIRSSKKAIIRNLLLCTIYIWVFNALTYLLSGSYDLKEMIFPISHGPWWFMTVYFLLILIAPFLEKMFETFNNKDWGKLLATVLVINVYFGHYQHLRVVYLLGYDLVNMLTVYCLGAFLRKPRFSNDYLLGGGKTKLIILFCFLAVLRIVVDKIIHVLNCDISVGEYCAPLTMAMAVNVFLIFKNTTMKSSRWIMFFSSSAVGVYLITDYPFVREYLSQILPQLYSEYCHNGISGLLFLFVFSILLFIASVVIDKLRMRIQGTIEFTQSKVKSIFR